MLVQWVELLKDTCLCAAGDACLGCMECLSRCLLQQLGQSWHALQPTAVRLFWQSACMLMRWMMAEASCLCGAADLGVHGRPFTGSHALYVFVQLVLLELCPCEVLQLVFERAHFSGTRAAGGLALLAYAARSRHQTISKIGAGLYKSLAP
jgi:hypothetical protein